jgi:hypothetical protein
MTGNLFGVEFLGVVFLIVFIFYFSLYPGLFSWLLDILLELLFLCTIAFIYQVSYHSMHFLFQYIENTKKIGIFHWLAFLSLNLYH